MVASKICAGTSACILSETFAYATTSGLQGVVSNLGGHVHLCQHIGNPTLDFLRHFSFQSSLDAMLIAVNTVVISVCLPKDGKGKDSHMAAATMLFHLKMTILKPFWWNVCSS